VSTIIRNSEKCRLTAAEIIHQLILLGMVMITITGCGWSGDGKSADREDQELKQKNDRSDFSSGEILATPQIKFDTLLHDIGLIHEGEQVIAYYEYFNIGGKPLIISKITAGCGCTVPTWRKEPIASGESGTIKVIFNSSGKNGIQDIRISVFSNARNSRVDLRLKGIVESS